MSSTHPGSAEDALYGPYAEAKRRLLAEFDAAYVRGILERARGNRSEAARLARLDRSNFKRLERKTLPAGDCPR